MKVCSKCKVEKPKADFGKHSSNKDGLQIWCKKCRREYAKTNAERLSEYRREYDKANAEKIAERQREYSKANAESISKQRCEYRKSNREKINARKDEYRAANRERINAWKAEYYAANRERINARQAEYRAANPDKFVARNAAWVAANPDKKAAANRNRRARKRNADGKHTAADIRAIFDKQRGLCANCQTKLFKSGVKKYHVDHIMPLKLGGSNWPSNLQCLCQSCNLRKWAKHPDEWAQQNGRLI